MAWTRRRWVSTQSTVEPCSTWYNPSYTCRYSSYCCQVARDIDLIRLNCAVLNPADQLAMPDSDNKKLSLRASRVTRDDVARHAQVSTAVVSYVINNGPRTVAPETRRRVEQAIAALGYFPNTIARSLRSDQSNTIGLLLPSLTDPECAQIACDLQSVCHDEGYLVVLCASERDLASEERALGMLRNHQVDGVVILPTQDSPALLRSLLFAGVPTVVIDRYLPNVHSITVDDLAGGWMGTQHLLALGHRRIGILLQDIERTTESERLLGYSQALASSHIAHDERLIQRSAAADSYDAMRRLLRLPKPPTAILTDNHTISLGAMRAIYAAGLRIPDDISIVGYGASALAASFAPPLTTVQCSPFTLGHMAAQTVLRLATRHDSDSASASILPVALMQRASTAPPRRG
jgi:LacI family transcriptional regulator